MKSIKLEYPFGEYDVQIIEKNIKNVHLKVFRDFKVIVSAPVGVDKEWINEFVFVKKDWIGKQLEKYRLSSGYNNLTDLKSGSSTQFLGKDMRVSIINGDCDKVEIDNNRVIISLRDLNNKEKENKVFSQWWRFYAQTLYNEVVDQWMPVFKRHGVEKPRICIRKMKTLWGSCSKRFGKITLNEYLLKADRRCIEYVVLHELTHLIYNAHNKDFYDFLTIYMPDWKERKKRLDIEVVQGL